MKIWHFTERPRNWVIALSALPLMAWFWHAQPVTEPKLRAQFNLAEQRARQSVLKRFGMGPSASVRKKTAELLRNGILPSTEADWGFCSGATDCPALAGVPGADPAFTHIERRYSRRIQELADLSSATMYCRLNSYSDIPGATLDTDAISRRYPYSRMSALLSVHEAAQGHWDKALSYLKSATNILHPFRSYSNGLDKSNAAEAYQALLYLYPDAAICRKAVTAAAGLEDTGPLLVPDAPVEFFPHSSDRMQADGYILEIAQSRSFISRNYHVNQEYDSDLRWPYTATGTFYEESPPPLFPATLPWTLPIWNAAILRQNLHDIPNLQQRISSGGALYQGLDPLAAVVHSLNRADSFFWRDLSQAERTSLTKRYLTQAAFAARAYRLERGRWPASLQELVPDYLPALPKKGPNFQEDMTAAEDGFAHGNEAYGKLHCGMVKLNTSNVCAYLGAGHPTDYFRDKHSDWPEFPLEVSLKDNGVTRVYRMKTSTRYRDRYSDFNLQGYVDNGLHCFLAAQLITQRFPKADMTVTDLKEIYLTDRGTRGPTEEVTVALSEQDVQDRAEDYLSSPSLRQAGRMIPRDYNIEVTAEVKLPAEVFAVWSDGLDGYDGQAQFITPRRGFGMVQYLTGDLVVFVPDDPPQSRPPLPSPLLQPPLFRSFPNL